MRSSIRVAPSSASLPSIDLAWPQKSAYERSPMPSTAYRTPSSAGASADEPIPEIGAVVRRTAVAEGAGDHQHVAGRRRAPPAHIVQVDQLGAAEPAGQPRREILGVAGLRRPQHQRPALGRPLTGAAEMREYRPASRPSIHSRTPWRTGADAGSTGHTDDTLGEPAEEGCEVALFVVGERRLALAEGEIVGDG